MIIDGIRVISQSPREISVLCPPDSSNTFFLYFGAVALLIAGFSIYKRSWGWCFFALVPAVFALVMGGWALTSVTTIDVSADTGTLVVRNTVAGISVGQHTYRLADVEGVRVGFMRGGKYLYVDLANGNTPQLLPTSYRGGYQQAADALNAFLGALGQGVPQQTPSQ
jgi:hypothetical protein